MTVVREATVGPESGTRSVLTGTRRMLESGQPSSSAAICATTVKAPWPSSVPPMATFTEPSGRMWMSEPAPSRNCPPACRQQPYMQQAMPMPFLT